GAVGPRDETDPAGPIVLVGRGKLGDFSSGSGRVCRLDQGFVGDAAAERAGRRSPGRGQVRGGRVAGRRRGGNRGAVAPRRVPRPPPPRAVTPTMPAMEPSETPARTTL